MPVYFVFPQSEKQPISAMKYIHVSVKTTGCDGAGYEC